MNEDQDYMQQAGVVCKAVQVKSMEITDNDLKKINKYTLVPLTADEVFVFKAVIADNEHDDRNFMPFNLKSLKDMAKLYAGRTMLKDHSAMTDNQIARVYDTEIVQSEKITAGGELHTELIAKIYMPITESNKEMITAIKAGIKKEVSTACMVDKCICSICGTDNKKDYCRHWPGREYDVTINGKNAKQICRMLIDGVKEAYELSFVAIPAQRRAGTQKFVKPAEKTVDDKPKNAMELRIAKAKIKTEKEIMNYE